MVPVSGISHGAAGSYGGESAVCDDQSGYDGGYDGLEVGAIYELWPDGLGWAEGLEGVDEVGGWAAALVEGYLCERRWQKWEFRRVGTRTEAG